MIIYDLEIQNLILGKDAMLPDFTYCNGWTDFVGMGLSCLVFFDSARNEYRLFDEFMLDELKLSFARTDLVVGYNILSFDNKVLAPYGLIIPENKCYDLLVEIAKSAGTPGNFKGLSLNAVCEANFNAKKTGSGADAPKHYQRQRFGQLFDYCLADVRLTKQLLDRIIECGHIINPRDGKWIRVNRPR